MLKFTVMAGLVAVLPVAATQAPQRRTLDDVLSALAKQKDWPAIIRAIDGIPPAQQANYRLQLLFALQASEQWARLLECSEKALTSKPDLGAMAQVPRETKARALAALGRHPEALAAYLANASLGDRLGYPGACAEALILADWPALQFCAEAILLQDPTNGQYLALRGEAMAKQEHYPEAEPVLEEAVLLLPTRAMAWADLACCRNEREAYREALEAADRAASLDPTLVEGLYNRGRANLGLKRYAAAQADYRAALALRPKDPALVANLEGNLQALGKFLAAAPVATPVKTRPGRR